MVAKPPKKHRLIRSLCWLAAAGALGLALVPIWFPWGLRPAAKHFGLRYAGYDRVGWTRFALTDVRAGWGSARLEVRRVECGLPTTWLWQRFAHRTNDLPQLLLEGCRLVIGASTTNTVARSGGSAGETLNRISDAGLLLQKWLPFAELTNGVVQIASSQLTIPQAQWRSGSLRAVIQPSEFPSEIQLTGRVLGASALELSAEWKACSAWLHTGFARTNGAWEVTGELAWLTNRAGLAAQFTTNSWWPTAARAEFPHWQIPKDFFKIAGYDHLTADFAVNLNSNRLDLAATARAEPTVAANVAGFSEVKLSLGADADATGVTLRTLNLQSPWLSARATNTIRLAWTGETLTGPLQLRLAGELEKLPGVSLNGPIEGVAQIEPTGVKAPDVQFQISAWPRSAGPLAVKYILARGGLNAPLLKLDELRADFSDASQLAAAGRLDIETHQVEGVNWRATGGFLKRLLSGFDYKELVASGELSGPLTNLTQRGKIELKGSKFSGLKPLDFRLSWAGQPQQLATKLEADADKSRLSISAAAVLGGLADGKIALSLNQVALSREARTLYTLAQPCAITFKVGGMNPTEQPWSLAVAPFNWQGDQRAVATAANIAWPVHGEVKLQLTNVALVDFSDFLQPNLANILAEELTLAADWSNGPVRAVASVAAAITNAPGDVFDLRSRVNLGERLMIEQLSLATVYAPTLSVTGALPVRINPQHGAEMLTWDHEGKVAVNGTWRDGRPKELNISAGAWGRLALTQPDLRLQVSGSLDHPMAELSLGAAKLNWLTSTNDVPLPEGTDVHCALEFRPNAVRLKTFTAKLDGQPISATGEWPLPADAGSSFGPHNKFPDWSRATGRLQLGAVQLAAFKAYLPGMLAPEGQLAATLELSPGKRLAGVLTVTNAATRPLGNVTPLRDIAARLRLDGFRAVLEDFHGQIGGQPINADGFVSVADLAGHNLDYQINLSGTNIPLARTAELLVRGDLALALRQGSNAPPRVSGLVTLRDGLYVQNTSALVWTGPVRPEWRPPYFSVTNEPFADWQLDLGIRGDHFLRVRTPVFSGICSADFQLQGPLRTPVLTGDARVDSGRLVFPFGALSFEQGMVSFGAHDLRGPDLQINAAGRNYRYEVRLEVKGPADGANVILSSTPPLSSEQILLMLTAGEVPQSDFSFSSADRASRLGTFLGTDLLNRYLGTDPAKERLILRSGESISNEGRLTYSVEYLLTDRWSIIGDYDEFNAFNASLKWKVIRR